MPDRKSSSYVLVYVALIAITAGAAIFSTVVYFHYIAYDRVALEHVPPDTVAVAYVDVEKMTLWDPVRRYLLPLVDELGASRQFAPRLERIKRRTGLNPALQLREIAWCRGRTASDWVLVLGGKFPGRGLVAGIARVLQSEGPYRLSSDGATLTAPSGWVLGRAADGALIVASSAAELRAALPDRDGWRALGLDDRHAGSFYASGAWLAARANASSLRGDPALAALGALQRVSGSLELEGAHVHVDATLRLEPGRAARAVRPRIRALLEAWQTRSRASRRADFAGERRILAEAKLGIAGPAELETRFRWPRADMARGAAGLAKTLQNRLGKR